MVGFGASGQKNLRIETTFLEKNSVQRTITGKQYNRGVRALKIVYGAFQRLKMEAAERWLKDKQNNNEIFGILRIL